MTSSGEDYFVVRKKKDQRKKKFLAIISIIGFGGSMLFGAVGTIQRAMQNPQPQPASVSVESSLQEQAQDYELVLRREPENQVALEKLALLRIKLEDFQGAMEPLEKLTNLHPDRQDYNVMLEQVQNLQTESDR
ncbi:tetratricopeptide repeat protein [Nodularia sp. UHCC 0506]|uniref:tetratricopeptide repeat protein n=1 Tax=Nodularia sp. UHCC 0506 TaxID=3110243 RepID=UPI002B21BC5F|nr:tetratricopeptide repeat protein [Nodularia sp. UHCC 0506]MEA5515030.1 tetratricopeptide repeat protein [Nodularia sp. UHCC 0506]